MKKIIISLVMILAIITLVACGAPSVDKELDRIIGDIPTEFYDDLDLPSSELTVSYIVSGCEFDGKTIKYNTLKYDKECVINVTVSNGSKQKTASKTIYMRYSKEKRDVIELEKMEKEINEYIALLPTIIEKDFALPEYTFIHGEASITVNTTLKYKDGKYIYNYPESSSTISLKIKLENGDLIKEKSVEIKIASIEEKNSVPRVYLSVDGKITKEEYLKGTFSLEEKGEDGNWSDTYTNLEMKIKGRGNSTWGFDKKPYKIKFTEKVSLFGEKKAKTWTLIANYIDHSLMRNYAAYYLGRNLDGLAHTTSTHYVDLYLNGVYQGNYLVCEQVEVDKNRLNITDDDKIVDTGFLLELDQKYFDSNTGVEGKDYFYLSMHGSDWLFAMHTPDPEESDLITDQVAFIKAYLKDAAAALKANTDAMYDYFDLDSAVDSFIINEITKNKDVGWSSFYIHKDVGGKICFGPIWDYDLSSLAQGNISSSERSAKGWYTETSYKNPFYDYLIRNDKFKKAVKARWNEIKNGLLVEFIDELYRVEDYIYYSATKNFELWDVIGKETGWWISSEEHALHTWQEQVDLLINYYKERIAWMDEALKTW